MEGEKDVQYWLQEFSKYLVKFGVISRPVGQGNWKWKSHQFLFLIPLILDGIRHLICSFLPFISDKNLAKILQTCLGDIFKPLGQLATVFHVVIFMAWICWIMLDRLILIQAERQDKLYLLYPFYPKSNHRLDPHVKEMIKLIKYIVFIIRIMIPLFYIVFGFLYAGLYLVANLEAKSWTFALSSFIWTGIMWYISVHCGLQEITNHGMMFMSTYLTRLKIRNLYNDLTKAVPGEDLLHVIFKIYQQVRMIRRFNELMQNLLRLILIFLGPIVGLVIFTVVLDSPLWFKVLVSLAASSFMIILIIALKSYGSLMTNSRSLLIPLYYWQAIIVINRKNRLQMNYRLLLEIKKCIHVLSANRSPAYYTLPDGTEFTPLTVFAFVMSFLSLAFLLLNNSIIKHAFIQSKHLS